MPEMDRGPTELPDKLIQFTCGHLNYSVARFHAAFSPVRHREQEKEDVDTPCITKTPEAFWTLLQLMWQVHI